MRVCGLICVSLGAKYQIQLLQPQLQTAGCNFLMVNPRNMMLVPMFLIYETIQAKQWHHIEIWVISSIKLSSLLENNHVFRVNRRGKKLHVLQSQGGKTLAWLLAGRQAARVRIGLYFWKGVCVWIGRLVRSAEIFPTAATVRR